MRNETEISRNGIIFIILVVLVSYSFSEFLNQIYAQEWIPIHEQTLYEIEDISLKQHPHIAVGEKPLSIAVDSIYSMVYVANYLDNTFSVIAGTNHSILSNFGIGS